ncbi:MAG: hypothetical protein JWL82_238 [Parcubacteria group bacterium]|nr:hypothetical protein [Parcubacteria group bacterium]
MLKRYLLVLIIALLAAGGAYELYTYNRSQSSIADPAQMRLVISGLGDELQQVHLYTASSTAIAKEIDTYYAFYVHPDLLAKWKADPLNALGRLTATSRPDRIDITKVTKVTDDKYVVDVNIVTVTNGVGATTTSASTAGEFTVVKGLDGWQITDYKKL